MEDRWEREVLRDVAFAVVKEQRRSRRWGIFFKLVLIAYVTFIFLLLLPAGFGEPRATAMPHTAVIDVVGPIMGETGANADRIIQGLQSAFNGENVSGVVLRIDSPGGSPVQAGRINDEILRLRAQRPELPVYAVIGEMSASGAYYVAVAADRIYVDKASLVGSIGVLMGSFGLSEAIDKLGIERRLYTAGQHKDFLDPFQPEDAEHVRHVQELLDEIHDQFVAVVKEGRGDRLTQDVDVFNGLIWTGERSIELGLAEELGSLQLVAREVIGAEETVNYTPPEDIFSRFADRFGVAAATRVASLLGIDRPQLR